MDFFDVEFTAAVHASGGLVHVIKKNKKKYNLPALPSTPLIHFMQ